MKKTFFLIAIILAYSMVSFAQEQEYMTLEVHLKNRVSDTLLINQNRKFIKAITVNKEGYFRDTLRVETGSCSLFNGKTFANVIFVKNGYNLTVKRDLDKISDSKNYWDSTEFSGIGEEENNALKQTQLFLITLDVSQKASLSELEFDNFLSKSFSDFMVQFDDSNTDSDLLKYIKDYTLMYQPLYKEEWILLNLNGTTPPPFVHENAQGEKIKLSSFKGSYVLIDIWATWCGPCRKELPYLEKMEESYHGKNIKFIGLSVDSEKDKEKWKTMVADRKGTQIISDNTFKTEFIKYFKVRGIPRFILLGPEGDIVSSNLPLPSNPKLREMLDTVLN